MRWDDLCGAPVSTSYASTYYIGVLSLSSVDQDPISIIDSAKLVRK